MVPDTQQLSESEAEEEDLSHFGSESDTKGDEDSEEMEEESAQR